MNNWNQQLKAQQDKLIVDEQAFWLNVYGVTPEKYEHLAKQLYGCIGAHGCNTITGLEQDEYLKLRENYKRGVPVKKYTYEKTVANLNRKLNETYCNSFDKYKKYDIKP